MIPTNPIPEHLSTIILTAVKEHSKQLGVGSLALILKGSKSKILINRKLFESKFFGALFYYQIDVIKNFIKQLLEKKLIGVVQVTGNPYPLSMLMLTVEGQRVLENKIDFALEIRKNVKPIVLNESINETFQLFLEHRDISKIAQQRNLVESTIWKHLIDLVKLGKLRTENVVSADKIQLILDAKHKLPKATLKELKENLLSISYEEIRCVLAGKAENTD